MPLRLAARGRPSGTIAGALVALLLSLALPVGAAAHAVVERTQPAQGAALERAPQRVAVTFDEPVESSFGALRVFAADGERVDVGEVERPDGETLAVRVADDLPDGAYTVTYGVVSADSHPVAGGYVFTVGRAGGVPAAAVSDLLDEGARPVTEVAFGAARAVAYGATALLAGGLAFLWLVWLPAWRRTRWDAAASAFAARGTRLLVLAAVVGMTATALGIALQAATVTGGSFWSALDGGVLHDVLNTRFGDVWKLRFSAFAGLAALLLLRPELEARGRSTRTGAGLALADRRGSADPVRIAWSAAAFAACACLVVSPALGGHAGAGDGSTLLVPLDAIHVAAMSAWIGGVAALLLAVPAATRRLAPPDRTRLLADLVRRFSTVALASVAALLASGVAQSILQLDVLSDLVDTAFGRAILVKSAIFLLLVALGAYNQRRSKPQLARLAGSGATPGNAGIALRRALRAEVALMALVLAVTAALVSYSPSAGAQDGPYSTSAEIGDARIELTVDPARAGANEIHVYLFDARSGTRYDRPRRLTIDARERERDIGPIALDVRKSGPGHYTAPRADLAPAGDWALTVRAPVSDFEELRAELEVPIR